MAFLEIRTITTVNLSLCIAGSSLCFLSYLIRLAIHLYQYKKQADFPQKAFRYLLFPVFLGYFGWGLWSGIDPVKMSISSSVSLPLGVALTAIGFGLFGYSELKKGSVGDEEELVTTGLYSKIRHPMYIGMILFHIGYPLIFKSFVALLSVVVWAAFIFSWKVFEEKNLERRFGKKYTEYKKRTWF